MKLKLAAALLCGACAMGSIVAVPANAQAQQAAQTFNIPPTSLKRALELYTQQTGIEVIYRSDEVGEARSAGATGFMSRDAAMRSLLRNTGFTVRQDASGAIAIVRLLTEASLVTT